MSGLGDAFKGLGHLFTGDDDEHTIEDPSVPVGTINPQSLVTANAVNAANKNTGLFEGLGKTIQPLYNANQYSNDLNQGANDLQMGAGQTAAGVLGVNSGLGFQNAGNANAAGQNMLGQLGSLYGGIDQTNQQGYAGYQQAISPYFQQTPGMPNYQAISSDPNDVARQMQAFQNLNGIANGSGDISAAQYQSNQGDIARQQQAYNQLNGIASGSLDWQSQGAQAYADPATVQGQWNVLNQLQGVAGGSMNVPSLASEARASDQSVQDQHKGLDKLWGLTDPSITASERFMMEQARRGQETQERASRGAVMSDLSARGMSGSGAQLSNMLGSQEQQGQERTLADLGAQANAQNRSTQALGMYIDASGKLRSQEFDEAFARASAGDAMAVANANRRLQAMGMSADQLNNMRSASFDEAYKRGLAADQASASNQATRAQGAGMAASQANAIRSANDQVGEFNVGETNRIGIANQGNRTQGALGAAQQSNSIRSADDVISMHNSSQQTIYDTNNMEHGEREAKRITDLAGSSLDKLTGIGRDAATMGSDLTGKGLEENDRAAGRNQTAINASGTNAINTYNLNKDIANSWRWTGQDSFNRTGQIADRQSHDVEAQANNNINVAGLLSSGPKADIATAQYNDAKAALNDDTGFSPVNPTTWFGF